MGMNGELWDGFEGIEDLVTTKVRSEGSIGFHEKIGLGGGRFDPQKTRCHSPEIPRSECASHDELFSEQGAGEQQ